MIPEAIQDLSHEEVEGLLRILEACLTPGDLAKIDQRDAEIRNLIERGDVTTWEQVEKWLETAWD